MAENEVGIGIDVGGTSVKMGLVTSAGVVLERLTLPTAPEEGYESLADRLADGVRLLNPGLDVPPVAIGLATPGPLDPERGVVVHAPNLPCLTNRPIAEDLSHRCKMPVFLENDANAAALGEWWVGAGERAGDMVVITVGTGIGGGLILGGRLYRGSASSAGELGHMTIEPNGPPCGCGNSGCLEALASAPAIAKRAQEKIQKGFESVLLERVDGDLARISAEAVSRACEEGDALAIRVMEESGRYLGIGVANLVNLLNPTAILFGGGVAAAGDFLLDPIKKELNRRALLSMREKVSLRICTLGNDAGFMGAARVAFERVPDL